GFGVQFVSYYSALSYSLSQNKTLLFVGNSNWNYNYEGCSRGLQCFFRAFVDIENCLSRASPNDHFQSLSDDELFDSFDFPVEEFRVMLGTAKFYLDTSDANQNKQSQKANKNRHNLAFTNSSNPNVVLKKNKNKNKKN